jgi:hypothetical protein
MSVNFQKKPALGRWGIGWRRRQSPQCVHLPNLDLRNGNRPNQRSGRRSRSDDDHISLWHRPVTESADYSELSLA